MIKIIYSPIPNIHNFEDTVNAFLKSKDLNNIDDYTQEIVFTDTHIFCIIDY